MDIRSDPYLDDIMIGWIHKTARQWHWRVADWCDLEDLIQDGKMCYAKCKARYRQYYDKYPGSRWRPTQVDKREFMALVQTSFLNHLRTISAKRQAYGEGSEVALSQMVGDNQSHADLLDSLVPPNEGEAELVLKLNQAPQEIKDMFAVLLRDGLEAVDYTRTRLRWHGDRLSRGRYWLRETTNEHYCRLLGLDPSQVDVMRQVRDYLCSDYTPTYATT